MAYRHHSEFYDTKYKENVQRRALEDMLAEWYGKDFAAEEITCRTDEPKPLSALLDKVMQEHLNLAALLTVHINEAWDSLIGPPLNRFAHLSAVKNNTVIVEVSHPAFLMQLRQAGTAEQWLEKLLKAFPELPAEKVVFVPAGRTPGNRQ